jgi:hypothetical protein
MIERVASYHHVNRSFRVTVIMRVSVTSHPHANDLISYNCIQISKLAPISDALPSLTPPEPIHVFTHSDRDDGFGIFCLLHFVRSLRSCCLNTLLSCTVIFLQCATALFTNIFALSKVDWITSTSQELLSKTPILATL